jgi:hypothetical protein
LIILNFSIDWSLGGEITMPRMLVVSPDPQTARMLSLAFELEGWETDSSVEMPKGVAGRIDAIVYDFVEGDRRMKAAASELEGAGGKGAKRIAILPRGLRREKAQRHLGGADLIVSRPFDLASLVRSVAELAGK